MRYSPEALTAFVESVACGSFSAAARRLRKSQSTISTAIANLEADLGVTLFDRTADAHAAGRTGVELREGDSGGQRQAG